MSKELSFTNTDGTVNLTNEDFNEIMWQRVTGVSLIVKSGNQEYRIIGFDQETNSYVLVRES